MDNSNEEKSGFLDPNDPKLKEIDFKYKHAVDMSYDPGDLKGSISTEFIYKIEPDGVVTVISGIISVSSDTLRKGVETNLPNPIKDLYSEISPARKWQLDNRIGSPPLSALEVDYINR